MKLKLLPNNHKTTNTGANIWNPKTGSAKGGFRGQSLGGEGIPN